VRCAAVILASLLALSAAAGTSTRLKPTTTDNDDSCDISVLPAATLLLPYFEVDFSLPSATALTTLFTVQNTTALPQIARVTLWTDWSYPMLTFNVFLTGYDVQGINLYDIFARGFIAPGPTGLTGGTSNTATPGDLSLPQNPHFLPDAATTCAANPGLIVSLLPDLQAAFTTGKLSAPGCTIAKNVGGVHKNAIGFATIDVVANCNTTSPMNGGLYFAGEILFDNVLTGDVQHINPNPATGNYAGGNPLVHIRAVPEGGAAGSYAATNLPFTFYDLYTTGAAWRTQDRRQPLPSAFMPRFIEAGTGFFNTNLQIWREAIAAPTACPIAYDGNAAAATTEVVRFDEHENATFYSYYFDYDVLQSAANVSTNGGHFPPHSTSGDVGGWLFLNLNNGGSTAYSATRDLRSGTTRTGPRPSQAWVVTSMFAEGRYAVEMDAVAVGNGCSGAPDFSRWAAIGPAPNPTP
jgi:hypothetical protein